MIDKKIAYISYDGMLEPLGHSQVLNYLKLLSKEFSFFIISFEKKNDLKNKKNFNYVNNLIQNHNIYWEKIVYSKNYFLLSKINDLIKCSFKLNKLIKKNNIKILHARGYFPFLICLIVKFVIRKELKIIFDMRGFWFDERYEWGIWKKKYLYLFFKKVEKLFLNKSSAIITLTEVGLNEVKKIINNKKNILFTSIPTCANISEYKINNKKKYTNKLNLIHLGSISTRYKFKEALIFYNYLKTKVKCNLKIINYNEHEIIYKILKNLKISNKNVLIKKVDHFNINKELLDVNVGIFFPKNGYYLNGFYPTKIAEFLASGIPIITSKVNKNVENLIIKNNVGIIIKNFDEKDFENAYKKISALLLDKNLSFRCRKVAEKFLSTQYGISRYTEIYNSLFKYK